MNELILSTTNAPAKFSFKNAKLNEISAKIAEQSAAMNSVYNAAKEGAEAVNKASPRFSASSWRPSATKMMDSSL